jgi:tellurite resistance protein
MQPAEIRTVIAKVLERPEFEGTGPEELAKLVESSAQRLSSTGELSTVMSSLRVRLPDHRTRLLAFGLATAVALADRKAVKEELGLLKSLQAALGISEDEVASVFECVELGHPLAEAVGEPLERLLAETMVLVATADGVVHQKELKAMLEEMAGDPIFKGVSLEHAELALSDAVSTLALQGLPQRLAVLAHGLTTRGQRVKAFELALKVAMSHGTVRPQEQHVLDLVQATFGLADDEIAAMKKGG